MSRPLTTASLAARIGTTPKQVIVWANANYDELRPVGKQVGKHGGRASLTWHWAPWRAFLIRTGRWADSGGRTMKNREKPMGVNALEWAKRFK